MYLRGNTSTHIFLFQIFSELNSTEKSFP